MQQVGVMLTACSFDVTDSVHHRCAARHGKHSLCMRACHALTCGALVRATLRASAACMLTPMGKTAQLLAAGMHHTWHASRCITLQLPQRTARANHPGHSCSADVSVGGTAPRLHAALGLALDQLDPLAARPHHQLHLVGRHLDDHVRLLLALRLRQDRVQLRDLAVLHTGLGLGWARKGGHEGARGTTMASRAQPSLPPSFSATLAFSPGSPRPAGDSRARHGSGAAFLS